jgi:DNA topoisomerase-1
MVEKRLLIVESPSKCGKIEEYLNSSETKIQYKCIASRGHIRQIADGLKSIDTAGDFTVKYSLVDEDRVRKMRDVISLYTKSAVILATDDDREGEAIAWHICAVFDLPVETTKRIRFHEITKPAIQAAVQSPTTINMNLVYSQQARQVLDMLVGYKTSPLLWKYICHSKEGALSAGRCQTPALRLVYENAEEGKTAEIELRYKITGHFFEKQLPFSLNHSFRESEEMEDFLERSKEFVHHFRKGEKREVRKGAPKPLNTSRILQLANQRMSAPPKETMSLCQILYQLGFITYMRTDSQKYSGVFLKSASEYILDKWRKPEYISSRLEDLTAAEKDPHEAIRPTSIQCVLLPSGVKELDANPRLHTLYRLIWQTALESCMADARYNATTITISAPKELEYTHTLEVPVFLGWQIVGEPAAAVAVDKRNIKSSKMTATQDSAAGSLLYFSTLSSDIAPLKYVDAVVTATRPHSYYTEASLIQRLEDLGIGRPSTFATIVETIQDRGYVKCQDIDGVETVCKEYKWRKGEPVEPVETKRIFGNEKRKLIIQPVGILAVEFLLKHFQSLFSYDYTKTMESELDAIVEYPIPDEKRKEMCANCHQFLNTMIQSLKNLSKTAYSIRTATNTISEEYDVCFLPSGPIIRQKNPEYSASSSSSRNYRELAKECSKDGIKIPKKHLYHSIKESISLDLDKLKRGEYSLEEIIEIKNHSLGTHRGLSVSLKLGKYGPYVEWGSDTRKNLKPFFAAMGDGGGEIELKDISLEQMVHFLDHPEDFATTTTIDGSSEGKEKKKKAESKGVLRVINDEMSIRKGKYGAYVFYKRPNMKDPEFLKLRGFPLGYSTCPLDVLEEWVYSTYNLPRNFR